MSEPIMTLEGKRAILSVYEDRAVLQSADRSKTIPYVNLDSLKMIDDKESGDMCIFFFMHNSLVQKNIHGKFRLKEDAYSREQAIGACSVINQLMKEAKEQQYKVLPSTPNKILCPRCLSSNIQALGENRKSFSVGKAIGGVVLTGGIGALAGFVGKKKGYDVICSDCGNRFQIK